VPAPVSEVAKPTLERLTALAAAALLGLFMSGCGGAGGDTSTAQSSGAGATGSTGTSGSGTGGTTTGGSTGSGTAGSAPTGPIYVVGAATLPAGATRVASLMAVPWASLPPGSEVLVSPGTWSGVTTITSVGTRAAPIVVTAADPAHPPVLANSVDFQHAAYVQVSHVTVQSPTYAGFVIRLGSHHIAVTDSTINRAPMGISITGAAGTGHQLLRNTIADSAAHGISVDVNADPAERTLIAHNQVLRSGQHGMELRASHYQVDYNTVTASGQASGGTSGIHLYSGSSSEDSGDDNLVRWNMSYANTDKVAVDGNGIEVDQWCDGNTVAYNLVWGNDGAGVIVYDGSNNTIKGNTAYGNGLDPSHTHVALGQIIVSGTAAATARGNHVWNNLAASTLAGVPAVYVDTRAVSGGNTIGANLYSNSAGGTLLRWTDSATKQTAALIDAATGSAGSVAAVPAFADAAHPLANGLHLSAVTTLKGATPTAGDVDFLGTAVQSGWAFFGAYYTAP
jgi:parallel beta-helix repeat protein